MPLPSFPYAGAKHPQVQAMLAHGRPGHSTPSRVVTVEGLWAHRYLLEAAAEVVTFLWCPEAAGPGSAECAATMAGRAAESFEISTKTMARVSRRQRGGGLASLVRIPQWSVTADAIAERAVDERTLVLIADGVEYSGNLGTLIRTVDACGADALVLTNRRARVDRSTVFTASRGTVLSTPVAEFDTPEAAAKWCADAGIAVYLADPSAPRDYRNGVFRPHRPTAIVVGSEGSGISGSWYNRPHTPVNIPMRGRADSLNVGVAAAILLFEARHQGAQASRQSLLSRRP